MAADGESLVETVTLSEAKALLKCAAQKQSFLMLSPPGVGKSDMVHQAATEAGLVCRSLLGTQIAPEDVSGVPTIVGERSVFCPPRILLPESPEPFCLFLDELPACAPDIQKAFYSLLLERRLGEHKLPPGTWVVAAGNRSEDRALVRTISSALVNRVILLQIQVSVEEWLAWAVRSDVREDVLTFITHSRMSLLRDVPAAPVPFSTPRAWASLSRAIDLAEQARILDDDLLRALAQGRVTLSDATEFCIWSGMLRRCSFNVNRLGLWGVLNLSVESLEISDRAKQGLTAAGHCNLRSVAALSEHEVYRLDGFDDARLAEVREALDVYGLYFGLKLS